MLLLSLIKFKIILIIWPLNFIYFSLSSSLKKFSSGGTFSFDKKRSSIRLKVFSKEQVLKIFNNEKDNLKLLLDNKNLNKKLSLKINSLYWK